MDASMANLRRFTLHQLQQTPHSATDQLLNLENMITALSLQMSYGECEVLRDALNMSRDEVYTNSPGNVSNSTARILLEASIRQKATVPEKCRVLTEVMEQLGKHRVFVFRTHIDLFTHMQTASSPFEWPSFKLHLSFGAWRTDTVCQAENYSAQQSAAIITPSFDPSLPGPSRPPQRGGYGSKRGQSSESVLSTGNQPAKRMTFDQRFGYGQSIVSSSQDSLISSSQLISPSPSVSGVSISAMPVRVAQPPFSHQKAHLGQLRQTNPAVSIMSGSPVRIQRAPIGLGQYPYMPISLSGMSGPVSGTNITDPSDHRVSMAVPTVPNRGMPVGPENSTTEPIQHTNMQSSQFAPINLPQASVASHFLGSGVPLSGPSQQLLLNSTTPRLTAAREPYDTQLAHQGSMSTMLQSGIPNRTNAHQVPQPMHPNILTTRAATNRSGITETWETSNVLGSRPEQTFTGMLNSGSDDDLSLMTVDHTPPGPETRASSATNEHMSRSDSLERDEEPDGSNTDCVQSSATSPTPDSRATQTSDVYSADNICDALRTLKESIYSLSANIGNIQQSSTPDSNPGGGVHPSADLGGPADRPPIENVNLPGPSCTHSDRPAAGNTHAQTKILLSPETGRFQAYWQSLEEHQRTHLNDYRGNTDDRDALVRDLLEYLFTEEERRTQNCHGKSGLQRLDPGRLNKIRVITFHLCPIRSKRNASTVESTEWSKLCGVIDTANRHFREKLRRQQRQQGGRGGAV